MAIQTVSRSSTPLETTTPSNCDTGLRLLRRLQSSLDPTRLLRLFFDEVTVKVAIDGLSCRVDELQAPINIGRGSRCVLIYSLEGEREPIGELTVSREQAFSQAEMAHLEACIVLLLPALRNALLYQQALAATHQDPVTGLGNRSALDECLIRELELNHRHGGPLALIMLELDGLRELAEIQGLRARERALEAAAEVLRGRTRRCDSLFRYAGDRFVIVMSRAELPAARLVADRLRQAFAAPRPTASQPLRCVITAVAAAAGDTPAQLFGRAEAALRNDRRSGDSLPLAI